MFLVTSLDVPCTYNFGDVMKPFAWTRSRPEASPRHRHALDKGEGNGHHAVGLDQVAAYRRRDDKTAAVTELHTMFHVSARTFTPWDTSLHAPALQRCPSDLPVCYAVFDV